MKLRFKKEISKLLRSRETVVLLACALFLNSCHSTSSDFNHKLQTAWLHDGSVAVSRPLPATSTNFGTTRLLGFIPAMGVHTGTWLEIDRGSKSLKLMNGDAVVMSANADGLDRVKPGTYRIMHKQTRPIWYAPDSYFTSRKLPVPGQAEASRFRRGALGDFAVFFNKESPIHNGPVWSDDVGGIRLGDNDIAKIYYSLDVDSAVEVR